MKEARDPQRLCELTAEEHTPLARAMASAIAGMQAEHGSPPQVESLSRRLSARLGPALLTRPSAQPGFGWHGGLVLLALAAAFTLRHGDFVAVLAQPSSTQSGAPEPSVRSGHAEAAVADAGSSPAAEQPDLVSLTQPSTGVKPLGHRTPSVAARRTARAPQPEAELRLLQACQAALLDHDPTRALTLAEQHRRAYPAGMLGQEREVLAIEAMLKLHQAALARARAEQFLATYPSSPHGSRLQALLARPRP